MLPVACFVAGTLIGVLLRDLGYFRRTIQVWPATEAITDRKKLDEMLAGPPYDH